LANGLSNIANAIASDSNYGINWWSFCGGHVSRQTQFHHKRKVIRGVEALVGVGKHLMGAHFKPGVGEDVVNLVARDQVLAKTVERDVAALRPGQRTERGIADSVW